MPLDRLRDSLTVDNLWLYILYLLKKEPNYAYMLRKQIKIKFKFDPVLITIYFVLYKLEGKKLIRSYFKDRRKYYEITKSGKEALNKGRKYLKELYSQLC